MVKKFIRTKEDFVCEKCGTAVTGTGYTNHCPKCLWSKHVDTNPGDRLSECSGMMQPIGFEIAKHEQIIKHRCVRCGLIKRNKTAPNDDADAIIALSARHP